MKQVAETQDGKLAGESVKTFARDEREPVGQELQFTNPDSALLFETFYRYSRLCNSSSMNSAETLHEQRMSSSRLN